MCAAPSTGWEVWATNAVGTLLAASSTLQAVPQLSWFGDGVAYYRDLVANGSMTELERVVGLPSATMQRWCVGDCKPSLDEVLRLSAALVTSPHNLLTGNVKG